MVEVVITSHLHLANNSIRDIHIACNVNLSKSSYPTSVKLEYLLDITFLRVFFLSIAIIVIRFNSTPGRNSICREHELTPINFIEGSIAATVLDYYGTSSINFKQ